MKVLVNGYNQMVLVKECWAVEMGNGKFDPSMIVSHGMRAILVDPNSDNPEPVYNTQKIWHQAITERGNGIVQEWDYVKPDDAESGVKYTDAGYIYLQGSLSELRQMDRWILLCLSCADGTDERRLEVDLLIDAKEIGYGMPDGALTSLDQEIAILIATPHMVEAGVFERPDYINNNIHSLYLFQSKFPDITPAAAEIPKMEPLSRPSVKVSKSSENAPDMS